MISHPKSIASTALDDASTLFLHFGAGHPDTVVFVRFLHETAEQLAIAYTADSELTLKAVLALINMHIMDLYHNYGLDEAVLNSVDALVFQPILELLKHPLTTKINA